MPILDLQRRLHETGRIRIGQQVPASKGGRRPAKLDTFRFTSPNRRALDQLADFYGGQVEPWNDAPVGQQWQVITGTAEIRIALPPEHMSFSQFMELWSGGGCQRRCDGQRQTNDEPCLCATLDADDNQTPRCAPHTRLSLMLTDFATSGLWRLDTQGHYASVELGGALELAKMISGATGRHLLPGWLRLEQREIRRPGERVKRFAVPVLDLEMDMATLLGPARMPDGHEAYLPSPAAGPSGEVREEAGARASRPPGPRPPQTTEGLTPIPPQPATSLAQALAQVADPPPQPRRRNSPPPLPDTGVKPRTAKEARSDTESPATQAARQPPITDQQLKKLHTLFTERRMAHRDDRLDWANQHLHRTIMSSKELTQTEASRLIERLEQEIDAIETFRGEHDTEPPDAAQQALDADPGPEQ